VRNLQRKTVSQTLGIVSFIVIDSPYAACAQNIGFGENASRFPGTARTTTSALPALA
jgi:hypothetical protein